jgi:hypothetical protein
VSRLRGWLKQKCIFFLGKSIVTLSPTTHIKMSVDECVQFHRFPFLCLPTFHCLLHRSYSSLHGRGCRYPGDQVPPRTSFRSRQKARHANHMPLRVVNLGVNRMAQAISGAATCHVASAPAAQPGAAPGSPRVPWRPNGRGAIKVTDIP